MKKNIIMQILMLFAFGLLSNAAAQPSDAQLKKQLMSPQTVSIVFNGPGAVEWSTTYKKYVWSRAFTRKLKSDEPGVYIIVKGYASYDVMGRRYVFWRTFISSNSYEGKKNPTAAEINQALAKVELKYFHGNGAVIEYESFKLFDAPNWEWHTPNSVSFYAVAVFRRVSSGDRYSNDRSSPTHRDGFRWIDTVREIWRVRIYRENEKSPWNNAIKTTVLSLEIPDAKGGKFPRDFLIEQKQYSANEVERMPRATKVPLISQ